MKSRKTAWLAAAIAAAALVYACGAGMDNGTTEVTVEIGTDGASARLESGGSMWARLLRGLEAAGPRAAAAAIPAGVYTVRLTVSGPGMTPVVREENAAGKSSVRIVVQVPNGAGRSFLVECLDVNGTVLFKGTSVTDLDGSPIRLAIEMIDLLAYYVDVNTGSDIPSCGAFETPCQSITYAISLSPGNQPIYVRAGTYTDAGAGGLETFPLSLKPGTRLKCIGAGHSSVISTSSLSQGTTLVNGAAGAVVEGCGFSGIDNAAVDDMAAAMTIRNNILVGCGISLSGDSLVEGNDVSRVGGISEMTPGAITVWSGSPTISGNILSDNGTGLVVDNGGPVITANTLSCNQTSDLRNGTVSIVNAAGNYWDHLPPAGNDYTNTVSGAGVDTSGAMLAASPCSYTLRIDWPGLARGAVYLDPPGASISNGSSNSASFNTYRNGRRITMTADPNLAAWGGDCASCGSNPVCQVTMDGDKTCTVDFY